MHGLGIIFQENCSEAYQLPTTLEKNHNAYSRGSPSLQISHSISQKLIRMQILRSTPNLLNQNCRRWGRSICVLIIPPVDSDAQWSLRIINLHQCYRICVANHTPVLVCWLMHLTFILSPKDVVPEQALFEIILYYKLPFNFFFIF